LASRPPPSSSPENHQLLPKNIVTTLIQGVPVTSCNAKGALNFKVEEFVAQIHEVVMALLTYGEASKRT